MASFLVRAYRSAGRSGQPVPRCDEWPCSRRRRLFAAGVTTGCSADPPAYCPTLPVLREQMAAFLNRVTPRVDPRCVVRPITLPARRALRQ